MNGIAFVNLPQLVELDVTNNECIYKWFIIESGSHRFRQKISRNCGSAEVPNKQLLCSALSVCDFTLDDSKCCELERGTVITGPEFSFATNANYTDLVMLVIEHQQNVDFLPVLVHEKFPMLEEYRVINTAVPKISKKNFEKMYKLERLFLNRNEIEVIRSDTFEDLINLQFMWICTYEDKSIFFKFNFSS